MIESQIEIIRPGLQTTIQDLGRTGLMHLGISHSGAMDELSLCLANRLVGMPDNSAVLEMTQVGADIQFSSAMVIAITGANMKYSLNNLPIPGYQPIKVNKGDVLKFHGCQSGFRAYLAINGHMQTAEVLSSYSTQLNAKLGGMEGRALKTGDVIKIQLNESSDFKEKWVSPLHYSGHYQIRYTQSPEHTNFHSKNFKNFHQCTYKVSQNLSRMGVRLSGEPVQPEPYPAFDSRGLLPGAIQIPPDGQPIITGKDAQTTGGYLRIGQVIHTDMPVIGQLKPDDEIEFLPITLAMARDLHDAQRTILNKELESGQSVLG